MLSQHPANLILRFVLEITALITIGRWGWNLHEGAAKYLLGLGLPLVMAVAWAVFRPPVEPGGGPKHAIIPVSGRVRLVLEAVFFGFAIGAAFSSGQSALGIALTLGLLLHYAWSADRVIWLFQH